MRFMAGQRRSVAMAGSQRRRYWRAADGAALLVCVLMLSACGRGRLPAAMVDDTVSWVNPTTRADGQPLRDLASVRVQWGKKGGPYDAGSRRVPATPAQVVIHRPQSASAVCYVTIAVDSTGAESVPSVEVCDKEGS